MVEQLELFPSEPQQRQPFANYPKSVAEVRALRNEDARLWTPRDALISLLRDIDENISSPSQLVMFYKTPMLDGSYKLGTITAGAMRHELAGICAEGLHIIITGQAGTV